MPFQKYIENVQKEYKTGIAREHAYRPALKILIEFIMPDVTAINDPAHIDVGAPDYILHRRKIDVGYIEAKDIGVDLSKTEKTDQLKRYLEALPNLILTDYLEFRFYLRGEKVDAIRIAYIKNGQIKPLPENYDRLKTLLLDFSAFQGQTIKSAKNLAQMMAHKAKLMKHVFYNVVTSEKESSLKDQLKAFQTVLVHDMTPEQFADVYAQTIAYGLFTARLHDKTREDFTRSEALLLIPKSNPFLRQLFSYVAGSELDDRVVWIVDALCEVFLFSDLNKILEDFGTTTGQNDPMLHFYETFLAEYDSKLRKSRGVFYTPEPVVNFIVRAIDDVLKTHFGLKDGIADKSKIEIEVEAQETDKRTNTGRKMAKKKVHKIQLLDIATGTGTFLAEAVKQIYRRFEGQEGIWSSYVENDLLPRMHGFELLMASYAMCHMKLDLLLQETGYRPSDPKNPERLSVYLTNSLEEYHPEMDTLFASWLSREANDASWIKKNMPIMVAFGNPPYSGHSSNKGEWIEELLEAYKQEPSGGKLKEKNAKWLNDDYVKFIRLGEYYINKNGEGILAYITNHSYLDNPTFRGMRWHLLNSFDDIYIVDLHGNAKKKETAPDGSADKNVFDIQQGVSIIVAVKKQIVGNKKSLAQVHHADAWGDRQKKYDFLNDTSLKDIKYNKLSPSDPFYMLVPRDEAKLKEYDAMPSLPDIMKVNVMGFQTHRDHFAVGFEGSEVESRFVEFRNKEITDTQLIEKYKIKDNRDWKIPSARQVIQQDDEWKNKIITCSYRPFDKRPCYFSYVAMDYPRREMLDHVAWKENLCLGVGKQGMAVPERPWELVYVSREPMDANIYRRGGVNVFPLYLYQEDMGKIIKTPNFDPKIYAQIKETITDFAPENLFDYIYAVLHSTTYRQRYAEFLKSDFPRIPYPSDPDTFHALAKHGTALRELHLMESDKLDDLITTYPVDGDHEVIKPRYEEGKVWINESQYFGGVPNVAWNFYIGGYQPAQKWLKDRKGRNLSVDDIMHYQRIIVALTETDKIMKQIDEIDFLPQSKTAGASQAVSAKQKHDSTG